jgi:hypothetical protein
MSEDELKGEKAVYALIPKEGYAAAHRDKVPDGRQRRKFNESRESRNLTGRDIRKEKNMVVMMKVSN